MLKSLSFILALVIALSTSAVVFAADKVVAIPFNSSKKFKNVVTVSATGGDFTDSTIPDLSGRLKGNMTGKVTTRCLSFPCGAWEPDGRDGRKGMADTR